MRKKTRELYTCLTLFKPDISELTQLFQNNLQNAEIVIDGIRIINSMQFEQFDAAYQAKSLLMRGFFVDDVSGKEEGQLIELKISKQLAHLSFGCNEVGKLAPEVILHIRMLLVHCQNRLYQSLLGVRYSGAFFLFIPMRLFLSKKYDIGPIVQFLLLIVGILLAGVLLYHLSGLIMRLLKMDTYIFILPGATRTSQKYGNREIAYMLVVELILIFIISGIIIGLS